MVPRAGCEVGWRPRRRSLEHRCVAAFADASSFAAAWHAQVAGPGEMRHVVTRFAGRAALVKALPPQRVSRSTAERPMPLVLWTND